MPSSQSLQHLKDFVYGLHPLSDDEWNDFAAIWHEGDAKRKTLLTKKGEVEKTLYFITEGLQRAYYLTVDNKEATIVFTYPFSFSGVADSFLTQTPSNFFSKHLLRASF